MHCQCETSVKPGCYNHTRYCGLSCRIIREAYLSGYDGRHTYLSSFFFSSRRRHTRFDCDWSSDVCSSDLTLAARYFGRRAIRRDAERAFEEQRKQLGKTLAEQRTRTLNERFATAAGGSWARSEERRVGKECRSRWSAYH